ncbi:MAG TPA: hypothetical protein VGB53_01945 [Rubricoccaceae bacterium]|jgi:hypothetical protein
MSPVRFPSTRAACRLALRLAGVILLIAGSRAASAVVVSPSALYLDAGARSATVTLYNGGVAPEEVTLSFAFGYPTSDEAGRVTVALVDAAPEGEPLAVHWLRAFPRQLRLAPGQRQVVRVLVQPPPGLPAGEYWGRLVVTARGGLPHVEERLTHEARALLTVETATVLAVTYRNGPVATGIRVRDARAVAAADGASLQLDLERLGTAAFVGRIRAELVAPTGGVAAEGIADVAVYRTLRRDVALRWSVPRPRSLDGYAVRYTVLAERPEIPRRALLPAPSVTGTTPLLAE